MRLKDQIKRVTSLRKLHEKSPFLLAPSRNEETLERERKTVHSSSTHDL